MKRQRTKLLFRVLNRHQARLSTMKADEARLYFEKMSKTRLKPAVDSVFEVMIGSDSSLRVRVYSGAGKKCPSIIFFHGGGFVVGSIDSHDSVARLLCKATGCTVISVDYRLAPEHPYPAAIKDGVTTLAWLQEQRDLNNKDIFLAGDSAGGQIALYTFLESDQSLRASVKGIVLSYPVLDPRLKNTFNGRVRRKPFCDQSKHEAVLERILGQQGA